MKFKFTKENSIAVKLPSGNKAGLSRQTDENDTLWFFSINPFHIRKTTNT